MRTPRILIVEDESLIAADLEQRLGKMGYEVAGIVDTGEDALEHVAKARPDLVLMDIRLKGELDGIETAGRLEHPRKVPVVFLTAHADIATVERAGLVEPFGFVVKPFADRELRATLEMAFCRVRAEDRVRRVERLMDATLRSIGDAVIATDMRGLISIMNPAAEALTGWSRFEGVGAPLGQVFRRLRAGDRTPMESPCELGAQTLEGVTFEHDLLLVARDGREVLISDSVAPIRGEREAVAGFVVVFREQAPRTVGAGDTRSTTT